MEPAERGSRGSGDTSILSRVQEDPELVERYERYVKKAKEEARNGNVQKSIEYFQKANVIHPSEKLKGRIAKLEEALQVLNLQNEEDEFIDVLDSGFMLYKDLYDKLFEHQKEGVAFLYGLYRDRRKGGILADDMGLGKTIQVIAFLSGMIDAELTKTVLLVMPTTLISNWVKEFEKWTPAMRVSEFHGVSKKERTRNLEKIQRKGGVLITTYQMLLNNWQQLSTYIGREFVWDYIILDEAHKIKSSSTKTAKSCAAVPAKNRILLTGTPIQNNLREMWALYDFACQGTLLGTAKTFKMEYENPITRAREKDATPGEKALGLKISENLMKIIQPYFLRRTKNDVQHKKKSEQQALSDANMTVPSMPSLTRKNDFIMWVYLSAVQEDVYKKFISLDQIKQLLLTTRSPLAELTILKKLCDHPRLLSARACIQLGLEGDSMEEGGDVEAVTKFDHLSDETLIEESGKLDLLIQLLRKLSEEGHRTLVFSQSRKMLDMVNRILNNQGFKVMRIDGTVSLPEREKRINLFQTNSNYSVLLLTTQVGGVGLTLTSADRVVIFDPSWNPATDAQAVDRAYRIGQQANVVIYRLITCGTVEEKIYRRQIFKDSLIRQTTGDTKNPFRYFSKQELKELFSLDDTRTSTTQIQLQNMHSAQRKTDSNLDEHIAYLHTLPIFGISDHDLIYNQEGTSQDECENEHEVHYIKERVQKAHELVQMESQMNEQLIEQIKMSTEGAWLRTTTIPEKPKPRSLPSSKPTILPPVTVDLTELDVGDVNCAMNSLLIDGSAEEEEKPLHVSNKRELPDIMNVNEESLVIVETSDPPPIIKQVPEDVNCQMTSLVIEDSVEEENLPLAPLQYTSPVEENMADEYREGKHVVPPVMLHSGLPSQDAIVGVSNERSITEAASRFSLKGRTSLTLNPEPPVINPLEDPTNSMGHLEQAYMGNQGVSFTEEANLPLAKSHLACDFNLVLEDSVDEGELCDAMAEMDSVMETSVANGEPLLVLDDSVENMSQECVNMENSEKVWEMNSKLHHSHSLFQASHCPSDGVQSTACDMNGVKPPPEVSLINESSNDEDDILHSTRRKATRRIFSESEEESTVFITDNERAFSPFNSPSAKAITASTPKVSKSLSDTLFSHRDSPGRRRSVASRRSLIELAVEEAADVEESIVDDESGEEEEFVADEAKEAEGEECEPTEEEPAGETLPDEEGKLTSGDSYESDSFVIKSSSHEEPSEQSTGEVELLSGEQVDCLAQEPKTTKVMADYPEGHYSTLVQRGKELKDSGNVKGALDCFLKALDIKSGDPEVMMITLNLYRQLS